MQEHATSLNLAVRKGMQTWNNILKRAVNHPHRSLFECRMMAEGFPAHKWLAFTLQLQISELLSSSFPSDFEDDASWEVLLCLLGLQPSILSRPNRWCDSSLRDCVPLLSTWIDNQISSNSLVNLHYLNIVGKKVFVPFYSFCNVSSSLELDPILSSYFLCPGRTSSR